ncbi:MAG: GNAT family N-acetyltransferase [Pseudomonadales bacterium]
MTSFTIRAFESDDMPRLYHICLLTGQDGGDASGTVDELILGSIYAAPYATFEPKLCFVLVADGLVIGYILGTRDSGNYANSCEQSWWPELRTRYPLLENGDMSRQALLTRAIHSGYQPPACYEEYPAHLHIDILPDGQDMGFGRQMIDRFCDELRSLKVSGVHFGVSGVNHRAKGFYEHLGFHIIETSKRSCLFAMHL